VFFLIKRPTFNIRCRASKLSDRSCVSKPVVYQVIYTYYYGGGGGGGGDLDNPFDYYLKKLQNSLLD
jgi:hypothetical protein